MKTALMTLAFATFIFVSGVTQASPELYLVETLVCMGQVNELPAGWAKSYVKASLKVTSFLSMRKDCTLANSVATTANFFEAEQAITTDSKPYIGDWFAGPLKIDGDKVVLPNGAWTGPLELTVTGRKVTGDGRVDTLEGRELISKKDGKEHFYDFICEATVVQKSSIVVNNTSCANP